MGKEAGGWGVPKGFRAEHLWQQAWLTHRPGCHFGCQEPDTWLETRRCQAPCPVAHCPSC